MKSIRRTVLSCFFLLSLFGGQIFSSHTAFAAPITKNIGALTLLLNGKVSADEAIEQVTTIAFMDADGPKVKAIVVKYNVTIPSGAVGLDTFDVNGYPDFEITYDDSSKDSGTPEIAIGGDGSIAPGKPTNVYVSTTPEIDPDGVGDASGSYVIIEVNTDYLLAESVGDWRSGVAADVTQKATINLNSGSISPGTTSVGNHKSGYYYDINPTGSNNSYTVERVFDDDLYTIEDLDGYKIYTDNVSDAYSERLGDNPDYRDDVTDPVDPDKIVEYPPDTVLSKVAGSPFTATDCFSEFDGEYHDVDLMYSIFVPSDYDASQQYMLVLHMEDAGALGTDPMNALTEAQAAANYASDEVQQIAKDQGYGGMIVVLPQVIKADQTMADNLTGNEYVPAVWQLLDTITNEYNIDMDRIYASGQSMGGMQVLDMAAQRDNYFAGIWAIGSQWGNNFNKGDAYASFSSSEQSYYTFPNDSVYVTNTDWQNWYYSISDDNILVTSMSGDATATAYWQQVQSLYQSPGSADIAYAEWDPITESEENQSDLLDDLLAQSNDTGIYWAAMTNGSHKATWVYAHRIASAYDWLLKQTKTDEDSRSKLALTGSYSEGTGTDGYNTLTEAAAEVTIYGDDALTVSSGSTANIDLQISTASSAAVSVTYNSQTTVDSAFYTAGSPLTIENGGSDISNLNTSLTNGEILTLSVTGNTSGTYTFIFTLDIGSGSSATTVNKTIEVTVQ